MLDLSIVTVGHNHCAQLNETLGALFKQDWDITFEVILVDNLSTDGTVQMVKKQFPRVFILENDKRYGFAKNINRGIGCAQKGRFILLLNPDVKCKPGSLETLERFMVSNPDVGLAGPKLLNPDMTLQTSCRRFTNPLVPLYRFIGINQCTVIREALMTDCNHSELQDVDFITGACMIVRREALADVGLMDEGFYLYCEDQDFCLRMWQHGWKVYYVPEAVMIHDLQRDSAKGFLTQYQRIHINSYLYFFRKHGFWVTRPTNRIIEPCSERISELI